MKKIIYRKNILMTVLFAIMMVFASCHKEVGPTKVKVLDPVRHYPSIVCGQNLKMEWRVSNVGQDPLVITDIQPSCGCICSSGEMNTIILPGQENTYEFVFNSGKYTGYVSHVIRMYGNVDSTGVIELTFDTNVIEPDESDYEEHYYRETNKRSVDEVEKLNYTVDEK